MDDPFIPGNSLAPILPLERFLPPLQPGMISSWIKPQIPKGSWVVDPVGNHPLSAIELASNGYRVLVAANNPIHAFLLEIFCANPTIHEFQDALDILGQVSIDENEQTKAYINSFYQVTCSHCGKPMIADRFLWHRDESVPFGFTGTCLSCGFSGEQSLSPEAALSLRQLPAYHLYRAHALESIASINDPLRSDVEDTLIYYPNRSLVLAQLITRKIPNLSITERSKKLLQALMLSAFDQLNTLWAYPQARIRPRQLVIPATYQETNLWYALTKAISQWQQCCQAITLKYWPDVPPLSGGISVYKGRFREINPEPPAGMVQAITSILPRPNQAFWTLSTLWTGWLWGKEAASTLKNVISRQRYDWNWHTYALYTTFQALHKRVREGIPLYALILENEYEFLTAASFAADAAGFKLKSLSISGNGEIAQSYWSNGLPSTAKIDPIERDKKIRESVVQGLTERGEPSTYQQLHANVIKKLHQNQLLAQHPDVSSDISITELMKMINAVFMDSDLLQRFGGGPVSLDTGVYWLRATPPYKPSLIDNVEQSIIKIFEDNTQAHYKEIRAVVYQACPGIYTPEDEVISACLSAYASPLQENPVVWSISQHESLESREIDKREMIQTMEELSNELKFYQSVQDNIVTWRNEQKEVVYAFYIITDAIISKYVLGHQIISDENVIVLPGSRANLLAFKLKRDIRLQTAVSNHWHFAKFRQLRAIRANPLLTRELFAIQIREDPPEYHVSQMAMF